MILLALSLGCTDSRPLHDSILWSGFQYEWETLSHRLSLVQAELNEDQSIDMGMIGGDWSTGDFFSDFLTFEMHHQKISDPALRISHGQTELTLDGNTAQTVSAATPAQTGQDVIGVALRGFRIDTDIAQDEDYPGDYNPAHGYTSSGFEIWLQNPARNEDTIQFDIAAQLHWGPQDRTSMNEAIPKW